MENVQQQFEKSSMNTMEESDLSLTDYLPTKELTRVVLNVSGVIFETWDRTLERFPATLLGDKEKRIKFFCCQTNTYFFNRNRAAFEAILFFYQSKGRLTKPCDISLDIFEEECEFFELPFTKIEEMKSKEGIMPKKQKKYKLSNFHRMMWNFVDNPDSSILARMFAIFSLFMIGLSVAFTCAETEPEIKKILTSKNIAKVWFYAETSINSWFLSELILRFIFSPQKVPFITHPLNIVDGLAVIPYFVVLAINKDVQSLSFLRILRFFRVVRLFRLGKHSRRIKIIGAIVVSSLGDLKLLLLCLTLVVILGGSMAYFAEFDDPGTKFISIPDSLWWAVQTVVVLGYGDIVPKTVSGKIMASVFMVFGAVTISLPVLSVVTRFTALYGKNMESERSE